MKVRVLTAPPNLTMNHTDIPLGLYTVDNGSENSIIIEIYEERTYKGTVLKYRNNKNFKGFEYKGISNLKPLTNNK